MPAVSLVRPGARFGEILDKVDSGRKPVVTRRGTAVARLHAEPLREIRDGRPRGRQSIRRQYPGASYFAYSSILVMAIDCACSTGFPKWGNDLTSVRSA